MSDTEATPVAAATPIMEAVEVVAAADLSIPVAEEDKREAGKARKWRDKTRAKRRAMAMERDSEQDRFLAGSAEDHSEFLGRCMAGAIPEDDEATKDWSEVEWSRAFPAARMVACPHEVSERKIESLGDAIIHGIRETNVLRKVLPKSAMNARSDIKGAPFVIVVVPSAVRCSRTVSALRKSLKRRAGEIPKLMGRNMPIRENKDFLVSTPVRLVVGTPGRILELLKMKVLLTSRVRLVVLDLQRNLKHMNMFRCPQGVKENAATLVMEHFAPKAAPGYKLKKGLMYMLY